MNEETEKDVYLEEVLTEAVAQYIGLLPAEEIRAMRADLRDAVASDPELQRLYQAARPRGTPARTHESTRDPADGAAAAIPPRKKEGAA